MENENKDFKESELTDIALVVEGKQLHVSKAILGTISPVFKAMLYGEYKEKGEKFVDLPGKSYKDMLEFLRCVYPVTDLTVKEEQLPVMLALADEYQVDKLKEKCCKLAIQVVKEKGSKMSAESLEDHFLLAEKFDPDGLLQICIGESVRFFKQTLYGEVFSSLRPETRFKILRKGFQSLCEAHGNLKDAVNKTSSLEFQSVTSTTWECWQRSHTKEKHKCTCGRTCCEDCLQYQYKVIEDINEKVGKLSEFLY